MEKHKTSITSKVIAVMLVMVFTCGATIGLISYFMHKNDSIRARGLEARSIAVSVAHSIDGDAFADIMRTREKNDYWYRVQDYISNLASFYNLAYLYLIDKNYDDEVTYFAEGTQIAEPFEFGQRDEIEAYAGEMFETLKTGLPQVTEPYISGEYGDMVSGFAPILDSAGQIVGVVGIDFFYDDILQNANIFGLELLGIVLGFTGVFMLILLRYLIKKMANPLTEITEAADKISAGDYKTRIHGSYTDEFAIVKESVNMMAGNIEAYLSEINNSRNVLENIMNGIDAFIYVTKPKTGEMLFVNNSLRTHFNIWGNVTGKYCYKLLWDGPDRRCDSCPCHQLDRDPGKVLLWEEHNPTLNRDYRHTDSYIDWIDGNKVHLRYSVDITDMKEAMEDKLAAEREALEQKHQKENAEASMQAKNVFLAKMSHEIRTPMNAVVGMTELILRKELPQDVYENAMVIKSASENLLSIINDILDFSKIESGMLEIIEEGYMLPSLINDVINIIRVRLIDKPVLFDAHIDPRLPVSLIGDEIRLRQVMINILSNAVKYTNEGCISLTVSGESAQDTVTLTMAVTDSGIGIRDEDMKKLFGDFVQIDTKRNKGVEGTGLGLAISRSLCRMMGGDITVQSEYGKGSTFVIRLSQKIADARPLATVDNPAEGQVLLYETREIYRDSIARTLDDLGVGYRIANSIPELFDKINDYPFIFITSFLCGSVAPVIAKLDEPPKLILIADISETQNAKNAGILTLPANPLAVANILNNVSEVYYDITGVSFVAPEARVLVVDDIMANLKVMEGLLLPYEVNTTICRSGKEAIALLSANEYDLVFMDHMMPEMDGIETAGRIRELEGEYYKKLPIIALTANAMSGVREMFIQNGMNDFLAKPIETVKLDATLDRWIPNEKRKKGNTREQPEEKNTFVEKLRNVTELSVDKALSVIGGSASYERIVRLSVSLLSENIERLNSLIESDLPNYAIEVHGIKGVLGNIGAYELAALAYELEKISKDGDLAACKASHPVFIDRLASFDRQMGYLTANAGEPEKPKGDITRLSAMIEDLERAADYYDSALALEIIMSVKEHTYGQTADSLLNDMSQAFERFDFDKALELLGGIKKEFNLDDCSIPNVEPLEKN